MTVAAVLSRMAAIEARFGAASAPRGQAVSTTSSFESVLGSQLTRSSTSSGRAGAVTGQQVLDAAQDYLGVPYVWGGTDPATGLDCSGFVLNVFRRFGIELPRVSRDQANAGEAVASMAEARPGDLLFFNAPVSHVAIYMGDGRMIHAAGEGQDVRITDVYETPTHIRRVTGGRVAPTVGGDYASLFASAGAAHGVDPSLLAAVAQVESGMDPTAVSPAGARGLMQLMPATAAELGVADPFDPAQAVDGAARLLRSHLDRFGSVELALAAYNAGAGAVSRHGGIPPYTETQQYVLRVMDRYGATS
jgi:hypothetical protein